MKDKHNDPTRLIDKPRGSIQPRYDNLERPVAKDTLRIDDRPVVRTIPVDEGDVPVGVSGGSGQVPKDDGRTKIFRSVRDKVADASNLAETTPVTGWLVIIRGPGRGQALAIRYGQQGIGRDVSQAICLDFGDQEISRLKHAGIVYDPKGRRFYIQPGEGTNLAYLNEAPVLAPTELINGAELQLGQTALRFVALCGAEFSWDD